MSPLNCPIGVIYKGVLMTNTADFIKDYVPSYLDDKGLETIEVNVPAIITCDLRLNEPRYASLPNIMKAKKKPIEQIAAKDLGVDIANRVQQLKVEEPPKRKAGIKVANVAELVSKLKNEAKVI